jgi:hypothetical protein
VIQNGRLAERLENHCKLQAELRFQESKLDQRVAREVTQQWKRIHKAMRSNKPGRFLA